MYKFLKEITLILLQSNISFIILNLESNFLFQFFYILIRAFREY